MKTVYLLGEVTKDLEQQLNSIGISTVRDMTNTDAVEGIVVRGELPVNRRLIDTFPKLKIIASAGIGYDNIDVKYANKRNIYVVNCPYANSISTAEHSVALMLAGMRNIVKTTDELRNGRWDRKNNIVVQWYGKKVGILGFGRIGRYVGQLYSAIGMHVSAFDPYVPNYHFIRSNVKRVNSIDELFSTVNYISVHLPRTRETSNIITSRLMKKLAKPNGIVNTCRGGIVNEKDILKELNKGNLDFYGADVFNGEPKPNHELLNHPRVLATPHIAANTEDAQTQVALDVVMQIREVLIDNKVPSYQVGGIYL